MRATLLIVVVCAMTAFSTACQAEEELQWVQQVPFGLSIFASPQVPLFIDTLTIYVSASASAERGPSGVVHVRVPKGLELISGDTTFTVSPLQRALPPHRLLVRALYPGTFEVRGTLLIATRPDMEDRIELGLPISVVGDTLIPGYRILHRIETSRGGQRFRYAGGWLLPIDGTEDFDVAEFERHGVKTRPIQTATARCVGCPAATASSVRCLVLVDRNGRVKQSTVLMPGQHSRTGPALVRAVRAALAKWRFQPAVLNGRPVSDRAYVEVPVSITP